MRKLYKVNVMKMGNTFSFNYDGKVKVYRGSEVGLKTLLRRLGAMDTQSEPKSSREKTFDQITQEIISQSDPTIYVWSNKIDKMQMIVTEATDLDIKIGTEVNFDYMTKVDIFINGKLYVYEIDKFSWEATKKLLKYNRGKFLSTMKQFLVKEEK